MIRQFLAEHNTEKARLLLQGALKVDKEIKAIAPLSVRMVRRDPKMYKAMKDKCKELGIVGTWDLVRYLEVA